LGGEVQGRINHGIDVDIIDEPIQNIGRVGARGKESYLEGFTTDDTDVDVLILPVKGTFIFKFCHLHPFSILPYFYF